MKKIFLDNKNMNKELDRIKQTHKYKNVWKYLTKEEKIDFLKEVFFCGINFEPEFHNKDNIPTRKEILDNIFNSEDYQELNRDFNYIKKLNMKNLIFEFVKIHNEHQIKYFWK